MGALRRAAFCGRELPTPRKHPFFTERELAARDAAQPASSSQVPSREGVRGARDYPHAASTLGLSAKPRYLALNG